MARAMGPTAAMYRRASFPAYDKIPEPARAQVLALSVLLRRETAADQAFNAAKAGLKDAIAEDRQALADLVIEGGSSAEFDYPATTAAKKAIAHRGEDRNILRDLLGQAYVKAVEAVRRVADEGEATADADVEATAAAYIEAIDRTEQARRAYLNALGLRYFWAHLDKQGDALANVGNGDEIVLARGPITRVDRGAFARLRDDAQAHTRLQLQPRTVPTAPAPEALTDADHGVW